MTWSAGTGGSCTCTATGCSGPLTRPKITCRRCSCGPGAPGTASRAGRARVPGCTGSPPTPAWTRCAVTPAGPCPRRPAQDRPALCWLALGHRSPRCRGCSRTRTRCWTSWPPASRVRRRQRAVLVLRDVVSWPAAEVAELLDVSVAAVNSALQRARTTLREQWPDGRLDWAPAAEPDPGQRRLLQRFIAAHEQADPEALIALLRDDIRLAISPPGGEWNGRPDVGDALRGGMNSLGQWRLLPIMANRQPGAAGYLRRPGQTAFVPFALTVLRFEHGRLTDIAAFEQPSMFAAFGLPASL